MGEEHMVENTILSSLRRHVSIRKYRGPVSERDLNILLETARRAPTAWNLANIHIIVVRDDEMKKNVAKHVGNQQHVAEAPVLLVFSIDHEKLEKAAEKAGFTPAKFSVSHFIEAGINAGIMASWTAIAAEALGYGVSFIALYSNPCEVAEDIGLPGKMVPILGLTIGVPGEHPEPRFRQEAYAVYSIGKIPDAGKRGEAVIELYERVYGSFQKAVETLKFVLADWEEEAGEKLMECLERRELKICD
jgi:FMN reductase [NAD(P)H]